MAEEQDTTCVCGRKDCGIPYGLCHCGCGKTTLVPHRADRRKGWSTGRPMAFHKRHGTRRPIAERFWRYVNKNGPGECWFWTASVNDSGCGQICGHTQGGRKQPMLASRVSWEIHHGPIPEGMQVLHTCDKPDHPEDISYRRCVFPGHLYLGTPAENMADKVARNREARGERHGGAKLNDSIVREIRKRIALGEKQGLLAAQFGVSQGTISCVGSGQRWKHVT